MIKGICFRDFSVSIFTIKRSSNMDEKELTIDDAVSTLKTTKTLSAVTAGICGIGFLGVGIALHNMAKNGSSSSAEEGETCGAN